MLVSSFYLTSKGRSLMEDLIRKFLFTQALFGASISIAAIIQLRNKPGKAEVVLTLDVLLIEMYFILHVIVAYIALVSMRNYIPGARLNNLSSEMAKYKRNNRVPLWTWRLFKTMLYVKWYVTPGWGWPLVTETFILPILCFFLQMSIFIAFSWNGPSWDRIRGASCTGTTIPVYSSFLSADIQGLVNLFLGMPFLAVIMFVLWILYLSFDHSVRARLRLVWVVSASLVSLFVCICALPYAAINMTSWRDVALRLQAERDEWGFGQVLAIFAWLPSFLDLFRWIYRSTRHRRGMLTQKSW